MSITITKYERLSKTKCGRLVLFTINCLYFNFKFKFSVIFLVLLLVLPHYNSISGAVEVD